MEVEQRQVGIMAAPRKFRHQLGLPPGFAALRADLGAILKTRRVAGSFGHQAEVAAEIGIAATNLSRIERGHAVPRLRTLEALLVVLQLGWDDIAIKNASYAPDPARAASRRRDRLLDAGCEIAAARRVEGLTLRELAAHSGLSLARLSRLERGYANGKGVYADHEDDEDLPPDERRLVLVNVALAKLVGRFRAGDGQAVWSSDDAEY